MVCLCSKFHRHRGRYISGDIKPIFPCHNCTLSCIYCIKLLIKETLLILHISNKGMSVRAVVHCLAPLHWDVDSASNVC